MSIYPVAFSADGGITVFHSEAEHGGDIAFADINFGRKPDDSIDITTLVLHCPFPGCGSASFHPIGGGAAPGMVQKLFVRVIRRRAAILGIPVGQRSLPAILNFVKNRAEAMDGPGRFKLANMTSEDDDPDDFVKPELVEAGAEDLKEGQLEIIT